MNQADMQEFNAAVALAQAGDKPAGHTRLRQLLPANPDNANLLLWLAFTSTDLKEAGQLLTRAGQLEPDNPGLAGARTWLAGEQTKLRDRKQTAPLQAPPTLLQPPISPTRPLPVPTPLVASTPPPPQAFPAQSPYAQYQPLPGRQAQPIQAPYGNSNPQPGHVAGSLPSNKPGGGNNWTLVIFGGAAVLAVLIAVTVFVITNLLPPSFPPDSEYTSYPTDGQLIQRASIGERVRVPANLEGYTGDREARLELRGAQFGFVTGGIILQIPKKYQDRVKFKDGQYVYFSKVTGREDKFLVCEVEQVR